MPRFRHVALFAVSVLLTSSMAFAGQATDVVKKEQTVLLAAVGKTDAGSKKELLDGFDRLLDYQAMAEAMLGSEWAKRSDAEKAQFFELSKTLVQKAYERNLSKLRDRSIEYVGEQLAKSVVRVKTKAVSKTNLKEEPIEITFDLVEKKGVLRVVDITTEGVSLMSSYRSQFTKIVKKDGFPTLITKMKDKIAKGDV